jgi:hypothetical protein
MKGGRRNRLLLNLKPSRMLPLFVCAALSTALFLTPSSPPARADNVQAPDTCSEALLFLGYPGSQPPVQAFYRPNCTSPVRQLTNDPAHQIVSAVLLPDGRHAVLSLSATASVADTTLVEVDIDTGAQTVIDNSPGQKLGLSASPGGSAVSYYRDPVGTMVAGVYTKSLDPATPPVRISPLEVVTYGVPLEWTSWSHDGARVAYPTTSTTGPKLVMANADGSGQSTILTGAAGTYVQFTSLTWAPDDSGLLYVDARGWQLWYVDLATRTPVQLTTETVGEPTVDQHWNLFYAASSGSTASSHINVMWLGDMVPNLAVSETGLDGDPSLAFSGPADPAPSGFPPGSGTPAPTTTSTTTTTTTTAPPPNRLAVKDVQITASPNDRLLTRTIKVIPSDSRLVARYEYGWAVTPTSTTPGSVQRCAVTITNCRLNYGPTKPDTPWNLLTRAVGTDGEKSAWFTKPVQTPKAPILVVFGDSIAAGHHRDSEFASTICQDENYSYGKTIWDSLQAQMPAQWRREHGYINEANSGFSTANVLDGGKDACGNNHPAELPRVTKRLVENAGSWNRVVGTSGIDDTHNWPDVLSDIILVNFDGLLKTKDDCQLFVDEWSLLRDSSVRSSITSNVKTITSQVEAADPLARTYWTSYYNIAGTGTLKLKAPKVCEIPFANGMNVLNASITNGLAGSHFTWVDIDPALGLRDNLLQDLYLSDIVYKKSGWPHPNRKGASKIGETILKAS